VLRRFATETGVVPAIWPLEIANVLLVSERRNRLSQAESTRFLSLLDALPISLCERPVVAATRDAMALARTYKLSSYDAAYLELALRRGLPLATRDRALAAAAQALGLGLLIPHCA
jgi:predicted nucleic acid-binding protein